MEEMNLNAEVNEEVVQPQNENMSGAENEEFTAPQNNLPDADGMSDEEFADYIDSVQSGIMREVQAEDADDNDPQEETEGDNSGIAKPAEEAKPYKTFATHEEYQAEFDRIMGERLKKNRQDMEQLDGLKNLALSFYGTDDGDGALLQLIEDLKEQNAEKKGVSAEEFNQQLQDSVDARKYREQQQRATEQQERIAEIQNRWMKESEDLKAVIPDFDFGKAMGNQVFYDSIINGMSVGQAYIASSTRAGATGAGAAVEAPKQSAAKPAPDAWASSKQSLRPAPDAWASSKQSLRPAPSPKRRPISQNGNSPSGSAGKVTPNVEGMSDTEFMRYIEKIKG